jgi:HSP20 family protein
MAMERWHQFGSADRLEPFRNLVDIQGEVTRLFDNFLGRPVAGATSSGRAWMPAVDMSETQDDLVLKVEVPGVHEKDVAVSITGDLLAIRGERRWSEEESREQKFLHVERAYGQFERLIQLPLAVQADKVKATYRDGVLEIKLPKAEELKPREIKIDIL